MTNGLNCRITIISSQGLDSNEPFEGQSVTNTSLPFGDAASILPVDAIQELNVETNATAEFGDVPRADDVRHHTGTHTDFSWFRHTHLGRDGAGTSRTSSIHHPQPHQPVQLEQWGGAVGGPIIKNKLF